MTQAMANSQHDARGGHDAALTHVDALDGVRECFLRHGGSATCPAATASRAPFTAVFERKEVKYLINERDFDALMRRIAPRLRFDDYAESRIASLYYDTPDFALVNRSIEKPLYKEKIRVRSYGQAAHDARVFVELKKKYKGIVYKRRFAATMDAGLAYMDGMPYAEAQRRYPLPAAEDRAQARDAKHAQIAHEIDAFRARHPQLCPSIMIATNRLALRSTDGSDVRLTFDVAPAWRDTQLDFSFGFRGRPLQPEGTLIMEVKCLGAYPLWLAHALSACRIFPQSSTKYGRAYELAHPRQEAHAALSTPPSKRPSAPRHAGRRANAAHARAGKAAV